MEKLGGIKLLFVAALALIIFAGTCAAVSLSNSGGGTWKYQREISIKENSGTELIDYQVLVELKGADFPGEAKSDGADVRFTDASGNELNYWIESWDYTGKRAKVWVKVPNIPVSSTTTIRMHYGNPSASPTGNGDKTFEFFDDFENNNLNKWELSSGWAISSDSYQGNYSGYAVGADYLLIKSINMNMGIFEGYFKFTETNQYHFPYISSFDSYCPDRPTFAHNRPYLLSAKPDGHFGYLPCYSGESYQNLPIDTTYTQNQWYNIRVDFDFSVMKYWVYINEELKTPSGLNLIAGTKLVNLRHLNTDNVGRGGMFVDVSRIRKYASSEPTITLAPPKSSSLSIIKSASPYSLRQFQESTIKVLIENSGTSEVKAIEIMDSIHPSFDLTGGDFPNPKKFDTIRAGESRELQYTIRSKESGAFTLDPATVTYADSEGNIQEVKSEPVSIKVVPSSDGGGSGSNTGQYSKSASVSLHGEKTDVVMGEDILLRLSAVNLITKPRMHVQVIIIPPSGMSVTSSEFSKSAAGQFTANYQLEPGDGKDIEVRIRSNQIGDFNVNGRIIYYFGDDKDKSEDQTLNLPIKVRKEIASTQEAAGKSTPGFEGVIGISGLLIVMGLLKRGGLSK